MLHNNMAACVVEKSGEKKTHVHILYSDDTVPNRNIFNYQIFFLKATSLFPEYVIFSGVEP